MSSTSGRAATCPSCGKVFDPMRSRFVRVREGKVMAFCSDACAAADVVALPATAMAATTKLTTQVVPAAAERKPPSTSTSTSTSTSGAAVVVAKKPPAVIVEDEEEVPRLTPRRRWRAALAALAVIVVGGMAIALVQNISPSSPTQVNAAPADRELVPAPEKTPAAPVVTPRERATTVLKELIGSPSPRIARAAAIGLARGCDDLARAHLNEAIKSETSEIARLENAYVLARCGDGIARQALVASLKNARRDVKTDAARHLIALGDDSGLPFLHALLGVSQHRLGAAEALARRKDEKALAALAAIHGNASTEPDDRLRAAIALGLAGDASVTDELRAALNDPRFRPAAAAALAELGDPSARGALVDGLSVPSLRVAAALALRRLSPDLDAAPLVAPLLHALATERDNSQVSAAEALLVLTGPATDAEMP